MRIGKINDFDFSRFSRVRGAIADFAVQEVRPDERKPHQVDHDRFKKNEGERPQVRHVTERRSGFENRMEMLFNPNFHRNTVQAAGAFADQDRAAFRPEPVSGPTSQPGALRSNRVQGRVFDEDAAPQRFNRFLNVARELQPSAAPAAPATQVPAPAPAPAAAPAQVAPATAPTAALVAPAPAPTPAAESPAAPAPASAPSTPAPAAAASTSQASTDLAREIASEQTYRIRPDGSPASLSDGEQQAIASQLARFSPAHLQQLQDNDISFAVVDPYNTPDNINWNMEQAAFYDPRRNTVYLSQYRLDHTVIHETAHALDDIMGDGSSVEFASQDNDTLQSAFNDYRARLAQDPSKDWDAQYNGYAATNILEFTAEGSRMFLENDQTRERLRTLDPKSYAAIEDFLLQAAG